MNKLKEKILASRIRKGDHKAFKEIYHILADRIYRFIFFRVPNEDQAQDLLQETFFRLWNYAANGENEIRSLQGLTYKIAKNLIADYYKNEVPEIDLEEVSYKIEDKSKDMARDVDIKINVKKINQKLNQLKKTEYKEIIELRYLDELSHKEIAQILDKTESAVRTMLHRALKSLKEIIDNEKSNN